MDPKEVKSHLKAAREAIKNKDFKEALKQCKAILKHDKANYNALVFAGVAAEGLEQPEQALMAYKKAIEADPAQPLAWQGLNSFYEKADNSDYTEDHISVYQKLLEIQKSDAVKQQETSMKLGALLEKSGQTDEAVSLYMSLAGDSPDKPKACELWRKVLLLLKSLKALSQDEVNMVSQCYDKLLTTDKEGQSADDNTVMWTDYIKHVIKHGEGTDLLSEKCHQMAAALPASSYPLEILCQIHLESQLATVDAASAEQMTAAAERLRKLNEEAGLLSLISGYSKLSSNHLIDASTDITEGVKKLPHLLCGWMLKARVQCLLHDKEGTVTSTNRGLKLLKQENSCLLGNTELAERDIKYYKLLSLSESRKAGGLAEAELLCEELLADDKSDVKILYVKGSIYLAQKKLDEAKQVLSQLEAINSESPEASLLSGQISTTQGDHTQAEESLQRVLEADPLSLLAHHWLCRVYWSQAQTDADKREKCFRALLQAAKLDPYFSDSFLLLGHYYKKIVGDPVKAGKCYKKSFGLDRSNDEAGAAYVDCLMATGDQEEAGQLLSTVTQSSSTGSSKWAWLRLGLCQLKQGEPSLAIAALQSALRADPEDKNCWECLGEAYMTRGSYTAALKAFTKVTELDPEAMYSFYQIASIKQTLGQHAEAVEGYKAVLENSSSYVPALKGLGETLVLLARAALTKFFHGRAVDHCTEALTVLTKAASNRPDLACLWKLLGDACTILHPVSPQGFRMSVPRKLLRDDEGSEGESVDLDKAKVMALGGRCYGMALKQMPDCASMWHDLGVNYYHQVELQPGQGGQMLAAKAVQVLQKGVTLDPSDHKHWNVLGVVAASKEVNKPGLAQHCFIKSIEAESNNVAAWTNLGTLYILHENAELAHEAFKVAQALEPSYVACWIGQAIVAEAVGHEDAMDLFRHTTELGNHVEGALGYAHWVCSMLKDKKNMSSEMFRYSIEQMGAITAASDALTKYTDRVKDNPRAFNMLGLLLERQKLYLSASEAFLSALELFDKEGEMDQANQTRLNYARALSAAGETDKALQQYQLIQNLCSFEDVCSLAEAYYRAGNYQESYQAYQQALELAATDAERSSVHAALGMSAYKAGSTDAAKTALFGSFQTGAPTLEGLQALCSVGLIQSDPTLTTAVIEELQKLESAEDSQANMTLEHLQALLMAMQGNAMGGKNSLSKFLHMNPGNATMWQHLSGFLLMYHEARNEAACRSARIARQHGQKDRLQHQQSCSLGSLAAGLHSETDSNNSALSSAQKAVHLNPAAMTNWCVLLAAAHADHVSKAAVGKESQLLENNISLAAHLMAEVESELRKSRTAQLQSLHLWCVKQYVACLLMSQRIEQASQFLGQAAWLYDSDEFLQATSAHLENNLPALKKAAQRNRRNLYPWQMLALLYLGRGMQDHVEFAFRQCLDAAEEAGASKAERLVPLLKIAYVAYMQILNDKAGVKWRDYFDDAVTDALKLSPQCPIILLMQGIMHMTDKKIERQGRRSLELALSGLNHDHLGHTETALNKQLLKFYMKKKDNDSVQKIIKMAEERKDMVLLEYYKNLKEKEG